jgi:CheY-like chemotaxis protein
MGNLLSNAVKFTPEGGKIQVSLEREESQVKITVADSGVGIKPDFLEHVFERFRQADASTTRRFGGLGLGLSIVKSLVESHGGNVAATSAGEGRGASFIVRLPALALQGEEAAPLSGRVCAPAPFAATDLAGLTLLVVDDDEDGRELARRVLVECNARVLSAGSAADALALVESQRPDMMISDIGMPEMDGFTLLKSVRALGEARGGALPAIALTAFARPEDRAQALEAGFAAHLVKPVEPQQLLAAIAAAVDRD